MPSPEASACTTLRVLGLGLGLGCTTLRVLGLGFGLG